MATSSRNPRDLAARSRYARHLILDGFGEAGQARVRAARVLLVGAGGLGAPVIQYLAAAGVGALTIVDDDSVEESNLNRQVLFGPDDVGENKAKLAARFVMQNNPSVSVTAITERLTSTNAHALVRDNVDIVVDCTDGLPGKYLLNDVCVVENVTLVHGAASAWAGQAMRVRAGGRPCLRCIFPSIPGPNLVGTCQTRGVLGPVVGVIGSHMALLALRSFIDADTSPANDFEHFTSWDFKSDRQIRVRVTHDTACPTCGANAIYDGRDQGAYVPARNT